MEISGISGKKQKSVKYGNSLEKMHFFTWFSNSLLKITRFPTVFEIQKENHGSTVFPRPTENQKFNDYFSKSLRNGYCFMILHKTGLETAGIIKRQEQFWNQLVFFNSLEVSTSLEIISIEYFRYLELFWLNHLKRLLKTEWLKKLSCL